MEEEVEERKRRVISAKWTCCTAGLHSWRQRKPGEEADTQEEEVRWVRRRSDKETLNKLGGRGRGLATEQAGAHVSVSEEDVHQFNRIGGGSDPANAIGDDDQGEKWHIDANIRGPIRMRLCSNQSAAHFLCNSFIVQYGINIGAEPQRIGTTLDVLLVLVRKVLLVPPTRPDWPV